MGFFKDFKDDFSQALNELLPGEDYTEADDIQINTLDNELDVEQELSKLDGLLEQVEKKNAQPAGGAQPQPQTGEPELMPLDEFESEVQPEPEIEPETESETKAEPEIYPEPEAEAEDKNSEDKEFEEVSDDKVSEDQVSEDEEIQDEEFKDEEVQPELKAEAGTEPEAATEQVAAQMEQEVPVTEPEPESEPVMKEMEPAASKPQTSATSNAEVQLELMKHEMLKRDLLHKEMMKEELKMDTMTSEHTNEQAVNEVAAAVTTPEAPAVANGEISDEVSVITAGTRIKGNMETTGSFEIEGTIEGDIKSNGKLTVIGTVIGNSASSEFFADAAHVEGEVVSSGTVKVGLGSVIIGNITATSAVIAGAVKGDIDVQGPVVVDTSAVIMGNIKSRSVQINNGAVIEGFCSQCYSDVDVESLFSKKN